MNVVGDFEALGEAILQKARTEAEQRIDRARRVAQRDVQHAREEMEALLETSLQKVRRRIEQEQRQTYAQIGLDVQRRRMARQEALIQTVFQSALDTLRSMPRDEKYEQLLVRLIEEGMAAIGAEVGTIVLNGVDREILGGEKTRRLERQVSERLGRDVCLTLSDQSLEVSGGAIIRSEDDRISFDNTFESRLERLRDDLRGEVAGILFGQT